MEDRQRRPRPLSPHLQVYKLPFVALTSIAHRITGAALGVAAVVCSYFLLLLAGDEQDYATLIAYLDCVYVKALLILASLGFMYHALNGIRHLFWDVGFGFEVPTANKSGIAVIIGAVAITALYWSCIFAQTGGL